jgi:hypothetical protein
LPLLVARKTLDLLRWATARVEDMVAARRSGKRVGRTITARELTGP